MSSSQPFGVTPTGFRVMQLQDCLTDLEARMQTAFGSNVDLSPETVLGQLCSVFSEAHALLSQAEEAVYLSGTLDGATGTSLDALLAQANLTRLPASKSRTNPNPSVQANGVPLYGFVAYGTPGTVVPAGFLVDDGTTSPNTFATDADITIQAAQNGRQHVYLSNSPTSGSYTLALTDSSGASLTTGAIPYNALPAATLLVWSPVPGSSGLTYTLTLGNQSTGAIQIGATAVGVQGTINALKGFENVGVTGSLQSGFVLTFPSGTIPLVTAGGDTPPGVVDSVQARLNALQNPTTQALPFADVQLVASGTGYLVNFGATKLAAGAATSGGQAVPLIVATGPSLAGTGGQNTTLTVLQEVVGAPAQGVGSATATTTGPSSVKAGALNDLVNSLAGLTSVTNQLDCLPGAAIESDAAAKLRFKSLRSGQGSASLGAVVEKVNQVDGVDAALGFQNLTNAAQQVLSFATSPTTGSFQLSVGGLPTGQLAYNAAASAMQAAINALSGYETVQVTGSVAAGLVVDFVGARGNQGQPLIVVLANSTGVALSVSYGRPAHSVELVVSGGDPDAVAQAILATVPAGIGTYSAPEAVTTATTQANSPVVTLASAVNVSVGQTANIPGVSAGAQVVSIAGSSVTLSVSAFSSGSGVRAVFDRRRLLLDVAGNPQLVGFSRPQQVLLYVKIALTTDQFVTPGQASSGVNASAAWNTSSIATIQQALVDIVAQVGIGGVITAYGTNSLYGAFNQIPGVRNYTLAFDLVPNPTNTSSVQLAPNQAVSLQRQNVAITYQ